MDEWNSTPEDVSAEDLEKAVSDFIARDGPGPDEMPSSTFLALWQKYEAERQSQVIELEQDILGGEVVLSVASTSPTPIEVSGNEIHLDDGRRIVVRLRRSRQRIPA